MNNKYIIAGAVAIAAVGTAFTSCSHDFDNVSNAQAVVDNYNRIFIENFGEPSDNQDWGFGDVAAARGVTRAVFDGHWDGVHNSTSSSKVPCGVNWIDTIQFTIPSGLVTVGADTKIAPNNNYYVPSTFNGKVTFDNNFNGNIYVAGTVTGYEGSNQGTVNIYIFENGSWKNSFRSGTTTFYNNGYLTLDDADLQNSNIKAIYNAGSFKYDGDGKNTNSSTYLYSTGTVELTADNVDFKLICDVHNTISGKNIKIQNSTAKYVCGIKATGKVENVDGPLVTSNVIANEFSFDGNPIYLTQGGHINVGTLKIPNSNCHVYAVTGSTALVEATNFEFGNKNDFTHTFSDNVYFKVNGGYIKVDNCYAMGHSHYFNNVTEYLESDAHAGNNQTDEYALAADRINAGTASGSPACGQAWSIGTPDDDETWDDWVRIIAEDLSAQQRTDFDFNDVVFDARLNATKTKAQIRLKAAGGTLPLTVGWSGEEGTNYNEYEVHNIYGVPTNIMVNTNAKNGRNGLADKEMTLTGDFSGGYNAIKIMVFKLGEWVEINAQKGTPAGKIVVTTDYKWCSERQDISKKYPDFTKYVGDPTQKWY